MIDSAISYVHRTRRNCGTERTSGIGGKLQGRKESYCTLEYV
eukprot:CAMPEP_0178474230 /NCGR_PEP_ID=MMETSP0696-20121128/2495_1 /TAXON_ID=265572 /ORGANISM="Extubocellulus spinifer, Strain CCMP396" /LENGTH=41 /DNA_ID= /DNA_START= /DNA_END= /DNA_ORIENTATION=